MLSVIMLTYNREKYISEMIEDILHQTYEDFEFIIVDNGSSDQSGCIADQYAAVDNRIKVIHLEYPFSIGYGRNIGLKAACGEYVAYIDDDDRLEKDYLEFLYHLAEQEQADIVMCGADELLNGEIRPQCMFPEKYVLSAEEAAVELTKRVHIRAGMPTKLIRRLILERYPFIETCKSEDIHTIYKYLGDAKKVVLHGIVKYHFIRHGGNNSIFTSDEKKWTGELLKEYLDAYWERAYYLMEKFPDQSVLFKYSVWSFMISMCDKVQKYDIDDCLSEYEWMKQYLIGHKQLILKCSFLSSEERKILTGM